MILVTGGTGLVGIQLLFDLTERGEKVRAIIRKSSSAANLEKIFRTKSTEADKLLSLIEWVEGDVQDYLTLERAIQGVGHIYHCAAMVSFDPKDKNRMMKINVDGTANVVNAALAYGVKKLCYVSSVAALGRSDEDVMIDENTDWIDSKENSVYAISKYAAEREVWRGVAEGLNAVIVNPSIIIGPGDPKKSSARLMAASRNGFPFYTTGINAWVDVRDVSRVMISLLESNIVSERFILATGNYTYFEVLCLLANGFGKQKPRIEIKPWLSGLLWRTEYVRSLISGSSPLITRETALTSSKRYFYSNEKIRKALNYNFIPIEECVSDNCRFFEKLIT